MAIDCKKVPNLKDITGQRFGRLIVKKYLGQSTWLCVCDCGKESIASTGHLRSGHTTSCGCWKSRRLGEARKTHGATKTRLFNVWAKMKARCVNPNDGSFHRYGGRGIRVCEEWAQSFEAFRAWALANGYMDDLTIDRIDNEKGYSPDNCRWATTKEQNNNRRNNRLISYNGETKTLAQWSAETGITTRAITRRLDRWGWSIGEALTVPTKATYHRDKRGCGFGN